MEFVLLFVLLLLLMLIMANLICCMKNFLGSAYDLEN